MFLQRRADFALPLWGHVDMPTKFEPCICHGALPLGETEPHLPCNTGPLQGHSSPLFICAAPNRFAQIRQQTGRA